MTTTDRPAGPMLNNHPQPPLGHLATLYREVVDSDQTTDEQVDAANEAAIDAIVLAGFDQHDSDQLGKEMGGDVQTLLAIAFIRCPELMELFNV